MGVLEFPLQIAVDVDGNFVLLGPVNRDQKLDEGGANEVTAAQLRTLTDLIGQFLFTGDKDIAGGVVGIDAITEKIDARFLPALALTNPVKVNSEAQMLALPLDDSIVAIRTDLGGSSFMLKTGGDPTILADWYAIVGGGAVDSVNGKVGVVTLNADDIAETGTRLFASPAEKAVWNSKQDQISLDAQPTLNSVNFLTSGAIYAALADKSASVEVLTFDGSDLDGDNRLNLIGADKDINIVQFLSINGIIQKPGTHYTVDVNGRYIELSSSAHNAANDNYVLVYFSDVPILSLNQVEVNNVNGLLTDGKVTESLLPEGVGGRVTIPFDTDLRFDKEYKMKHTIAGPVNLTLDNTGADDSWEGKNTLIYMRANGVDAPTFSNDFAVESNLWNSTLNTWNRIYMEYLPSGKVLVQVSYIPNNL